MQMVACSRQEIDNPKFARKYADKIDLGSDRNRTKLLFNIKSSKLQNKILE
jgi:hypothetical protein